MPVRLRPGIKEHARQRCRPALFVLLAFSLLATIGMAGQEPQNDDADRKHAFELYQQLKLPEALPLLEKLAITHPKDIAIQEALGVAILGLASTIQEPEARRKERLRARKQLLYARDLGDRSSLMTVLLEQTPEDGSDAPFSNRKDVDEVMRVGEAAFTRGDMQGALSAYQQALLLDPKVYDAALFSGDVCFRLGQVEKSYEWYARAAQIDPDQETAYRYWGDALIRNGRMEEARQKYIETIVAEPYRQSSWLALMQWAKLNNVALSQPRIESPSSMSGEGTNIKMTPDALQKQDGSANWLLYWTSRALWQKTFQERFPEEKEYRHSLAEESEALGVLASAVAKNLKEGTIKSPDPALITLIRLYEEGLLEPYILLGKADEGIAQDYASYRKEHRDKLIQYLDEYVAPPVASKK